MSAHPRYEEVSPLLEGEGFEALVADIKVNGLINPITLIDGRMILDGRNRIRGCLTPACSRVSSSSLQEGDPHACGKC